jgi:hypothetical protein
MIYVLAGNFREAQACAREHGLTVWRFLFSQEQLLGVDNPPVMRYGTYAHRKDWHAMERMIRSRTR